MLPGLYKVIGIALAAGSLLSGCAATPVPNVSLSNAERMQRGLPLKAPIKRFDPSRPRPRDGTASQGAGGGFTPSVFSVTVPLARRSENGSRWAPREVTEQYLWVDDTEIPATLSIGNFEQAIVINLPNTAQTDGPLMTTENPPRYLASYGRGSPSGRFFMFTLRNVAAPPSAGATDMQTSIWNYDPISKVLSTDRVDAPITPLSLGLSGKQIQGWGPGVVINSPLTIRTMSYADALAQQPPPITITGTPVRLAYGTNGYLFTNGEYFYVTQDTSRATVFYRKTTTDADGIQRNAYSFKWNNQEQKFAVQSVWNGFAGSLTYYNPFTYPLNSGTSIGGPVEADVWIANPDGSAGLTDYPAGALVGYYDDTAAGKSMNFFCLQKWATKDNGVRGLQGYMISNGEKVSLASRCEVMSEVVL